MSTHHQAAARIERIRSGAPMILRLSRQLERRNWRGGTVLQRLARKLGALAHPARYDLGNGITVDVPLHLRPVDEFDIREYETELVDVMAAAITAMRMPVRLFDCGADFGLVALKLVARCRTISRVIAIEPNAEMHPTLSASLARLPFHASAVLAAVGEFSGRGELRFPQHDPDSEVSRFIMPCIAGTVPITTIDALAGEDEGCVVLKCDVEGGELAVVRGARETLHRAPHFIVAFEAHPDHVLRTGIDPTAIVRELREMRACTAFVAETGQELTDDRTPLFSQLMERRIVNIVCVSVGDPVVTG